MTRIVRYSEHASYRRCPRQWYLRWFKGKIPQTTGTNLLEGQATHAGIQAYNEGRTIPEGLLDWFKSNVEATDPTNVEMLSALTDAAANAQIYLEAFPEWAEGEGCHDIGKETVSIEEQVSIPVPTARVEIRGRIDRAVRDEAYGGRLVVEDYKTAADFRTRPVQADAQLLTYAVGLSLAHKEPVAAGRHIRVKKNRRTSRANPPFFDTHDNVFTEQQLTRHMRHLTVWATKVEEARDILLAQGSTEGQDHMADYVAPPNPSFHCTSPRCPYLDLCSLMDDGSDWVSYLADNFVDAPEDVADDPVDE